MLKNRNPLTVFLFLAAAGLALLVLFVLLAITLVTPVRGAPLAQSDSTWRARYWNNKNLSGDPVLRRDESEINHDWGGGSPDGVRDDNFSARWTRTINFPAGTYAFTATMDDGMRVWVDDQRIIDSWIDSQVRTVTATVNLSGGNHEVKVEYYENGGQAVAKLRIDAGGSTDIREWRGEYFNNTSLSGAPALVRNDRSIDFNWGAGAPAPGIGADNFSVRWTRTIDLPAGRYRWTTSTDDGVRLWVNGRLIIDKWFDQSAGEHVAETDIPGGPTDVRMEYYEGVGGAFAYLTRLQLSGTGGGHVDWRGQYYNNKNLSGSPALTRTDPNIDFNWGNGSPAPGINADNFSVRWTRSMYLAPGRYRFEATTDDGVRLWINDQLIIDRWVDQKPTTSVGEITLPGGTVNMRMEYFENVGGARARLTRTQVTAAPTPTPVPSNPTGTVPGIRLNMREGPATSFDIIRVLAQGERVAVLGRNGAATWLLVQTGNGLQGWVYAPLLQITVPVTSVPVVRDGTSPQPTPRPGTSQTATVSNAIYALNVREGPGVTFNSITSIGRGQVVQLLGRDSSGAWLYIITPNNIYGWSSARYLDTNYPISSLPVTG